MLEFDTGPYKRDIPVEKILTDKEWDNLPKLPGLLDKHRARIDDQIYLYRSLRTVSYPERHQSLREQLISSQEKALDFLEALRKPQSDEAFIPCISSGRDGQLVMAEWETESCRRGFDEMIEDVDRAQSRLQLVLRRLHDKRGPKGGRVSLRALIDGLDGVLSQLEPPQVVSVSKKDEDRFQFVLKVCQIAHRPFGTLSQSTVKKAIATYNTERGLGKEASKDTARAGWTHSASSTIVRTFPGS